jgi:hypothetical protein
VTTGEGVVTTGWLAITVGTSVGSAVGSSVGSLVGSSVGSVVGVTVAGATVGVAAGRDAHALIAKATTSSRTVRSAKRLRWIIGSS